MKPLTAKLYRLSAFAVLAFLCLPAFAQAAEQEAAKPAFYASFWSLVPPIVAIVLSLITKEVYSSLFIGIFVGGLFCSNFSLPAAVTQIFENGFLSVLSSSDNVGILIFLVILGAMVCLMNKAGGSRAFGKFAGEKIKTRTGAQLATMGLGILIFIDDYFNCLTVGSVMKPVTDEHKISRAKLAYLIDATAAPVCIIAPISSWAAAVSGLVEGEDGFSLFLQAIPYNFYALLTFVMMLGIVFLSLDFGPMRTHEENAVRGDLFTEPGRKQQKNTDNVSAKGTVLDLILPIIVLIISCVIGMIYTGGFFSGNDFITAFSNSSASVGLSLGSICALLLTIFLYCIRRVLSFRECMECLPEGFQAMVPAILILTFAWTLKSMTDGLGAATFVASLMKQSADAFVHLLPAIIFLVGCFLAFATGTSWGTFGILIPIVAAVFENTDPKLMIISISACMAGAVCGDHCSPISDTTIMASAGAQCNHVNHVSTQLPYVLLVAAVSFVTYLIAGFTKSAVISLPIGCLLLLGLLFLIHSRSKA